MRLRMKGRYRFILSVPFYSSNDSTCSLDTHLSWLSIKVSSRSTLSKHNVKVSQSSVQTSSTSITMIAQRLAPSWSMCDMSSLISLSSCSSSCLTSYCLQLVSTSTLPDVNTLLRIYIWICSTFSSCSSRDIHDTIICDFDFPDASDSYRHIASFFHWKRLERRKDKINCLCVEIIVRYFLRVCHNSVDFSIWHLCSVLFRKYGIPSTKSL